MSVLEENRVLAHRLHQEIIQKMDLDLADEIIAPDCIIHTPVEGRDKGRGPQVAKDMAIDDQAMFPTGVTFDHYDVLAEGDRVAFRWVAKGTFKTGKYVEFGGIDIVRMENGKIKEVWVAYDRQGIQEQLS